MAIRYDEALNAEIRRVVKNFNQKRNRAIKRGFSYLPDKVYVSNIKTSFDNRTDLNRYIKELERFNKLKDVALETVETRGGGRTSRYNLMFIKDNLKKTKEFYDRQIAEAQELFYEDEYSIARRDYLFNLQEKRKYLELDIMNLDQSGIKTFSKYTNQALSYNKSNISSYKGFLSGVEKVMKDAGYDEKTINNFYEKVSKISPAQFVKMYRQNDLIAKLYSIIPSPPNKRSAINVGNKEAHKLIDNFMKNFDVMAMKAANLESKLAEINDYKDISSEAEVIAEAEAQANLTKSEYGGKIKKSTLTSKQLNDLNELGWMDLVDEDA
ncbi:MAG: hypothetical protein IKY26_04010 [Erysipelotrichaceae bacterium]|nr:hypothetical protein [Erysipelotrichaceae bacterium]